MKLEQEVCSLELAKKLKELGVKQESLFWWRLDWTDDDGEHWNTEPQIVLYPQKLDASAFTVAELGEMLPRGFYSAKRGDCNFLVGENYSQRLSQELSEPGTRRMPHEIFGSEADARAKMPVYLIDNKLVDVPKAA